MSVGAYIVNHYDLFFDAHDTANGSLYLGELPGTNSPALIAAIETLRTQGLWSPEPPKQIASAQKAAYAEQMTFVACVECKLGDSTILAARYSHPKYPSDEARWNAWLQCLA